jgi:hypothetical protein
MQLVRIVWRHQRGNQNPYIAEEQPTQWPEEKVQKDKQRSTKQRYKTKYRVTRTPLKIGGECICSERVSSSCSNSGTRRVNLVTKPVINHERGKDLGVITTSGTYQIYSYLCNQCASLQTLLVWMPLKRGVLETALCDHVYQWHTTGQLSSPVTPFSQPIKLI